MRTCSYCGKEYSDEVVQCSVDGQILGSNVPPLLPSLPATPDQSATQFIPRERQLRLIELVLVCTIAVGGSLLASIFSLFQSSRGQFDGATQWSFGILSEVSCLVLLWYVLLRRSKSFSDLGFIWKWSDLGWSVPLCIGGYIAYCLGYLVASYAGLSTLGRTAADSSVADYFFGGGITVITMIFLCINPFFEELIVRAFLISEVKYFTNSTLIAVVVSAVFQMAYHLYQGVPLALATGANFLLWSLYYAKTNRITPVILAHLYFDVGSTLIYVARH